jgi:hypothetical protein
MIINEINHGEIQEKRLPLQTFAKKKSVFFTVDGQSRALKKGIGNLNALLPPKTLNESAWSIHTSRYKVVGSTPTNTLENKSETFYRCQK